MRNRSTTQRRRPAIQLWTFAQARNAVPYITSIMRSVRDTWLEARAHRRAAERLACRPGPARRADLMAYAASVRAALKAEEAHDQATQELRDLGVLCVHSIRGEAMIPCVHQHLLAWIVFDLFAEDPLRCWRYHSDPAGAERPMHEMEWVARGA